MKEQYPECEKLQRVSADSQKIGDFLNWAQSNNIVLAIYTEEDELVPSHKPFEQLLAEYFNINLNKVEEERRAILSSLQK
jgi:hypothetical protein